MGSQVPVSCVTLQVFSTSHQPWTGNAIPSLCETTMLRQDGLKQLRAPAGTSGAPLLAHYSPRPENRGPRLLVSPSPPRHPCHRKPPDTADPKVAETNRARLAREAGARARGSVSVQQSYSVHLSSSPWSSVFWDLGMTAVPPVPGTLAGCCRGSAGQTFG